MCGVRFGLKVDMVDDASLRLSVPAIGQQFAYALIGMRRYARDLATEPVWREGASKEQFRACLRIAIDGLQPLECRGRVT